MDGATLNFEQDALEKIAELAIARKICARGLRSIIEEHINDLMYNLPDLRGCEVTITKDCIEGNKKPIIIKQSKTKKTS